MDQDVTGQLREVRIEAVITRADGTVEDLGLVARIDGDELDADAVDELRAELERRGRI